MATPGFPNGADVSSAVVDLHSISRTANDATVTERIPAAEFARRNGMSKSKVSRLISAGLPTIAGRDPHGRASKLVQPAEATAWIAAHLALARSRKIVPGAALQLIDQIDAAVVACRRFGDLVAATEGQLSSLRVALLSAQGASEPLNRAGAETQAGHADA